MALRSLDAHKRGRRPNKPLPEGPVQRCLFCGARHKTNTTRCWACSGALFVWGTDGDKDCLYTPEGDSILQEFVNQSASEAEAWIALVIEMEREKLCDRVEEPMLTGRLRVDYRVTDEAGLPPVHASAAVKVDEDECFWTFRE